MLSIEDELYCISKFVYYQPNNEISTISCIVYNYKIFILSK